MKEFQTIIGLEVHVELLTNSKMFCCCSTEFGKQPNTQVCPVCLGLPGTLPVANEKAIELGICASIALNCQVNEECIFVRKSYFYPDLPKNFQISQYMDPIGINGYLYINNRNIGIHRVHMEEDTGKLVHNEQSGTWSGIDFNRSGIPLMEIVTEPDITSPDEAERFLQELKKLISYTGVSDCNMEEGSLRCDANISVKLKEDVKLGTKVEVKNMNSFRSVRRALAYEQERITDLLKNEKPIIQETRLWNETLQITEPMRTKEEAHDYRYFPEPDLLPFRIDINTINRIKSEIGELPQLREKRFQNQYNLSEYDSSILTSKKAIADYFEQTIKHYAKPKQVANWIQTEILALLKETRCTIDKCKIDPRALAKIVEMVDNNIINATVGKQIIRDVFITGKEPEALVKERNLTQISDTKEIEEIIEKVLADNAQAVNDYKSGRTQALGFLVGQVMRKSRAKVNPSIVKEILQKKLN
ncbi:MAG TPA: Asp-tRNA(Asn)/Glu-tRNA(Gln) amidotransferase subunit GatB [bacterium]|nr:Asp-tRNA(Asn)/Glu-tRNA(Gln) amidotransferase subunit GatB [bacterium]